MHPELTSKVNSIIHQCWKAGESTELGKVKISVDGVFARLDERCSCLKLLDLESFHLQGRSEQCTRVMTGSPRLHEVVVSVPAQDIHQR